jgi:hypothetical protein
MGLFGGGNSTSSTTQNTNYNQYDQRTITDARQENSTTNTTLTMLDGGAIDASKSIALAGISNNATNTANLLAVADKLFSTQQKALDANTTLANSLASTTASAYRDAAGQAQGNKNLVYAGLAVVGVAAFSFFGKK